MRIGLAGTYRVVAGETGGWLLLSAAPDRSAYWLPQPPILPRQDALGHVLAERPVSLAGLNVSPSALSVDLCVAADWHMDWVVWRFGPRALNGP